MNQQRGRTEAGLESGGMHRTLPQRGTSRGTEARRWSRSVWSARHSRAFVATHLPSLNRYGLGSLRHGGLQCVVLLTILGAGCAHAPRDDFSSGLGAGIAQAQPPSCLTGPVALLLTNGPGFSAQLTLYPSPGSSPTEPIVGQLLARENRLIFAPDPNRIVQKRFRLGSVIFVWDVVENSGFVMSEALQGYAPVSFNVHPTNLVSVPGPSAPERIEGHPCREFIATVASSDGSLATFRVWRAADLNGLPLRLSLATNSASKVLSLSRIQLETPPAKLFQPPDGFARYESAETMMSELVIRQQKLKLRPAPDLSQPDQSVPPTQRRPGT